MKNRICLIGGNELNDYYYENGEYIVRKDHFTSNLIKKYDVDNFSYSKLSFNHIINELNIRLNKIKYNQCIISIDLLYNNWNEKDIEALFNYLKDKSIPISIISLDKLLNDYAKELANTYSFKVILKEEIKLKKKKGFSGKKLNRILNEF